MTSTGGSEHAGGLKMLKFLWKLTYHCAGIIFIYATFMRGGSIGIGEVFAIFLVTFFVHIRNVQDPNPF